MDDAEVITVGVMYPAAWETRPRGELEDDLARLRAIDPRIRVEEVRYEDPTELRTRRGTAGADGDTEELRSLAPDLTAEQREVFSRLDIVLTQDLPFGVGQLAPRLRLVQGLGAGVSQLVSAGLAGSGIRLTTAAGVSAVSISEFAIARLLAAWKLFPQLDELQRARSWSPVYGRELAGSTVAVLGLGAIGSEVARRLQAFDVHVLGMRRSYRPGMTAPDVDELFGTDQLHEVLGRADAVIAAVPETPESTATMDAAAFAAMRPGAYFCNVGRGSFVVEPALIEALESGQLGAAAIDVASVEPLPQDDPLWDAPNLLISPHAAASAERYFANLHRLFRDNVARYLAADTLRNEVDPALGY